LNCKVKDKKNSLQVYIKKNDSLQKKLIVIEDREKECFLILGRLNYILLFCLLKKIPVSLTNEKPYFIGLSFLS